MSFLGKLVKGGLPGKNGLPKNLPGGSKVPAPPGMGGGKKGPKPNAPLNMGVRNTSGGMAPRAETANFVNPDKGRRLYPDAGALRESMKDRAMRPDRR